jgi:23S rRNA U2552 (ribose-2'-O)-methylase RlmE/FtsJ
MTGVLRTLLQEGDVFMDLGANEGYFSIVASKIVGLQGKVISLVVHQGSLLA